ncbi:hypothetical protein ACFQH6_19615 [Halobacteriaceae archaeon GCM10025711]
MATTGSDPDDPRRMLFFDTRTFRDLGNGESGVSFPQRVMRDFDLLTDDGPVDDHEVRMAIYTDGTVELDLQLDSDAVEALDT